MVSEIKKKAEMKLIIYQQVILIKIKSSMHKVMKGFQVQGGNALYVL